MARLLMQVASGLQHLHEPDVARGKLDRVYHLNLKPENVLLFDGSGGSVVAKLCDFGLSKSTQTTSLPTLSRSAETISTHFAPEQFDPENPVGPANNVYSLGVVMWEWMTQSAPWAGHAGMQITRGICDHKTLVDVCGLQVAIPDCHPSLKSLALQCLSVAPGARPSIPAVMATLTEVVLDTTADVVGNVQPLSLATQDVRAASQQAVRTADVAVSTYHQHQQRPPVAAQRDSTVQPRYVGPLDEFELQHLANGDTRIFRVNITTLSGHKGYVSAVCFSKDGAMLATGSSDSTASIRAAATGRELVTLSGHSGAVNSMVPSLSPEAMTTRRTCGTSSADLSSSRLRAILALCGL